MTNLDLEALANEMWDAINGPGDKESDMVVFRSCLTRVRTASLAEGAARERERLEALVSQLVDRGNSEMERAVANVNPFHAGLAQGHKNALAVIRSSPAPEGRVGG